MNPDDDNEQVTVAPEQVDVNTQASRLHYGAVKAIWRVEQAIDDLKHYIPAESRVYIHISVHDMPKVILGEMQTEEGWGWGHSQNQTWRERTDRHSGGVVQTILFQKERG